jgi:Mg-chelatase subunit ChlD
VRGTLATREIAQGYGLIRGRITREALAQAAYIALRHRTEVRQGEGATIEDICKGIFSRLIYGIPLYPVAEEISTEHRRPLTPEELSQALMGLTDAAFRSLSPGEGLPVNDPAFAEEAMKHPLVQQALKDAMEKGLLNNLRQDYQELISELEDRGYLEQLDSSHMTLSQDAQQKLKETLEEKLARGELSPEELAEMLKNARAMPVSPGINGEKISLSPQAETELLAELMDFQHQGKSSSTSLEDLYVHYTLNEKKGIKVSPEKTDYEKLKIMLHQLEKKGIVNISGEKKRFTLSHLALEKLLEGLIRRQESQVLERRAFRREHETDKTEVRRYKKGDVFRDISTRHTLRRVICKAKTLDEINYTDLRSFEKKPSSQLDIAVCVDISASMKERGKLRYAKMAVAELVKAAMSKNDRMGIVAFSNLGEVVVPLTDKITPLLEATMTLRAEQYTNIGNGLKCARQMLLKDKKSNPKYIILITDGQPNAALSDDYDAQSYYKQVAAFSRQTTMETKKALGTHHALVEAGKTSRGRIKISVVFISPEKDKDEESEKTAREIARIGAGKFHRVKAIERLPLEALATVG